MELAELAAVLSAGNAGQAKAMSNMLNPQPNSLETGLGLQATTNPISALYYQAERMGRTGRQLSPEAIQAMQAAQQRDYELERIKATAAPMATLAGHSQAAVPGVADAFGISLDNELFGREQTLNDFTARSDAAQNLGAAGNQASQAGADLNDLYEMFGFDRVDRTTPTSVQSAVAGKAEPRPANDGFKFNYTTYTPGGVQTQITSPIPLNQDQIDNWFNQPSMTTQDNTALPDTSTGLSPAIPPAIRQRFNIAVPTNGFTPLGDITFSRRDDYGREIYEQRIVRPDGQQDILTTGFDLNGNPVTTLKSRLSQ